MFEPPNPILSKQIERHDEKVSFKFELKQEPKNESEPRRGQVKQTVVCE